MSRRICECDFRLRQWDANTGVCQSCKRRYKEVFKKIQIDLTDPDTAATFAAAEEAKREIASWPEWKRVAVGADADTATNPTDTAGPVLWDLVVEDMKARDAFGFSKYKRHLKPNDGRDTLKDAYEEALDLAVYLRKALYERDGK